MKVPVIVAVGLICFVVGAGAGAVTVTLVGPLFKMAPESPETGPGGGQSQGPPQGMGGPPGGGGGPGGGNRGPNPKVQLATLVTKIDQLTQKPLVVTLTDKQREELRQKLEGLEAKEELKEDEAKERFEAVLKIVEDQKDILVAAGYRWPSQGGGGGGGGGFGGGGGGPPPVPPNPFKDGQNAEHLKSLQSLLGKGTTP